MKTAAPGFQRPEGTETEGVLYSHKDGAGPRLQTDGGNLQRRDLEDFAEAESLTCLPEIGKDFSTSSESRLTPSMAVEEMIVLASKVSRCLESLR